LQTDPTLTGQGAGRVIDSGESVDAFDRGLALLEQDDAVTMLAGIHVIFDVSVAGGDDLPVLAYEIRRGELGASVVRGRLARQRDEVALGPATLVDLGRDVGDTIQLEGSRGTGTYRIVGSVLLPEGDFAHDEGAALATSGVDRLIGDAHDAGQIHQVLFEWAEDVDVGAAERELAAAGLQVLTNEDALQPATVRNLGEVEALPRYLAVFVGLLSLVALGHALAIAVRLRSRDLVTLRALGMTRGASTGIITSHALTITGVALAAGLPLGLAAGRQIWTPIANGAHVVVHAAWPWSWIGVLVVAAIAAAGALTAVPVWQTLRLRPADRLRAE
jgi:hypothetical protein